MSEHREIFTKWMLALGSTHERISVHLKVQDFTLCREQIGPLTDKLSETVAAMLERRERRGQHDESVLLLAARIVVLHEELERITERGNQLHAELLVAEKKGLALSIPNMEEETERGDD